MKKVFVIILVLSVAGLGADQRKFKHSYSNPEKMLVKNTDLDLIINFDRKVLSGVATLRVKRIAGTELWLDTSMLNIISITGDLKSFEKKLDAEISERGFGEPLVIQTKDLDDLIFYIEYESSPNASGLIWLDGEQTRSKEPFMFSVNEPIQARSWFPCQDNPAVRGTYTANLKIIANKSLNKNLLALISGDNNPTTSNSSMSYKNLKSTKVPIPSYLFAIAAGDLKYKKLSDSIGFYADNEQSLDDTLINLKDTTKYFAELTRLFGESPWSKQDFLFIPAQNGFVGMENPMLIYISEEILDKRYIAAHELAHMWTGNIATNKDWNALWVNEVWSTYFEDRLLEAIHGKEFSDANARKTYEDLIDAERERLEKPFYELSSQPTRMHKINAEHINPINLIDFSVYPKGTSMLRHIEKIIGRPKFDIYAQNYFKDFRYIPVSSDMFIEYSVKKLSAIRPEINWKSYLHDWIFNAGMTPHVKSYNMPEVPIP